MRPGAPPGFTLIEVLVTLFVIATLTSIVVLRIDLSDRSELARREAARFVQVTELAREEAQLRNEQWGMALDDEGYRFLVLDRETNRWAAVERRPFGSHELDDAIRMRLNVSDRGRIGGAQPTALTRDTGGQRPDLLLLSSGEMTPFDLALVAADGSRSDDGADAVHVGSDGFSRVALKAAPDAVRPPSSTVFGGA